MLYDICSVGWGGHAEKLLKSKHTMFLMVVVLISVSLCDTGNFGMCGAWILIESPSTLIRISNTEIQNLIFKI